MSGEWIALDRDALNPVVKFKVGNAEIDSKLSPYDVPTHIRFTLLDGEPKRIAIAFKYLDEEPTREVSLDAGGVVSIGKRSERLFGITAEIPPHAEAESMRLVIRGVAKHIPPPGDLRHQHVIISSRNAAQEAINQRATTFASTLIS